MDPVLTVVSAPFPTTMHKDPTPLPEDLAEPPVRDEGGEPAEPGDDHRPDPPAGDITDGLPLPVPLP